MNNNKISLKALFIPAAVLSVMAAAVMGYIYYAESDNVFRILLTLRNILCTFIFMPCISLESCAAFMAGYTDGFTAAVGYVYAITVFIAPLCTLAAVSKAAEKALGAVFGLRRGSKGENVLVFGWNENVKALVLQYSGKRAVHIIADEEIPPDEKLRLIKHGCRLHKADMFASSENEQAVLLKKCGVNRARRVILFHSSSVNNLSLLRMFLLRTPPENGKIICRCGSDAVRELINDLYGKALAKSDHRVYELETVSLTELIVRRMFERVPLYSYYEYSGAKLGEYDIHILIAGFGELGRETALQVMSLGVLHKENRIIIDVYDTEISKKKEIFLNRLDYGSFITEGDSVHFDPSLADGELTINFRGADITFNSFSEKVRAERYTYAVVTVDDKNAVLECMIRAIGTAADFPVFLRADNDKRLADYLGSNTNVHVINGADSVLTLDMILSDSLDKAAKHYNLISGYVSFGAGEDKPPVTGAKEANKAWSALELSKRDFQKACAARRESNEIVFEQLVREYSFSSPAEAAETLIGKEGTLLRRNGYSLALRGSDRDFIEKLYETPIAYDFLAMEHRRRCYFMASKGWSYGEEKDIRRKKSPCFMPQDTFAGKMPEAVKYDLVPLVVMLNDWEQKNV